MDAELVHLVKRLRDEGQRTGAFFATLEPDAWEQVVYTTGSQWTARLVLAHFVSAERGFHRLIADVRRGGEGAARDFDLDAFNESEVATWQPALPAQVLDAFHLTRDRTVVLARELDRGELERQGFHPWFGRVELREMLKLIYRHNQIHLRDVRRAVESRAPVPHQAVSPPARD